MKALIAIDTSEQAERVMAAAGRLLRVAEAPQIRVLTVTDDTDIKESTASTGPQGTTTPLGSWSGSSFRIPAPSSPHFTEDRTQALARVHGDLDYRNKHLAGQYLEGADCDSKVMSAQKPVDAILEAAREFGAEVIVVGTRGRRGLSRVVMGSTAEGIIRQSTVPVLVVGDSVQSPD